MIEKIIIFAMASCLIVIGGLIGRYSGKTIQHCPPTWVEHPALKIDPELIVDQYFMTFPNKTVARFRFDKSGTVTITILKENIDTPTEIK